MKAILAAKLSALALLFFAAAFMTGCQTTPVAVDWNSRVGTYTYDQCVAELGLPDKENTLSDGKIAYQWITLHGGTRILNNGSYGGSADGMGAAQPMVQTYRDHVLELTFDKNGKLVSAARNY